MTPPWFRVVRGSRGGLPIPWHCRAGVHARRGTFAAIRNVPGRGDVCVCPERAGPGERLRSSGTCRTGGTFAVIRNAPGRRDVCVCPERAGPRERPRAAYMPPLRPSVLSITIPKTGGHHNARPAGSRPRPTVVVYFTSLPSRERSSGANPVAAGEIARPTNRWETVYGPMMGFPIGCRGRMYAARTGIAVGDRGRDGRMAPVTSGVGRGFDPAVVPGGVWFMVWPPHPVGL